MDPRFEQALRALADAVRERLAKHPHGHMAAGQDAEIELRLALPPRPSKESLEQAAEQLEGEVDREIEALVAHRSAFRPGRVLCLRCASSECEHAVPPGPRHVFTGYGSSGAPRFLDFGQWLLQSGDARVESLYHDPPPLLTRLSSGRELTINLLPAFRDHPTGYHIHGQVTAGWFRLPTEGPRAELLALCFQVLSSARQDGRRRLGLNVLGTGPGEESLAQVHARLESPPWSHSVQWGQSVLTSIERAQRRRSMAPEKLSRRVEGLLRGMARRLEQKERARGRRTSHADRRHREGDRPTRMAIQDLARASEEQLFLDTRRRTLVVLGERGRAHVFSPGGKLVTSIRYSPDSIAGKQRQGAWKPASAAALEELRRKMGVGGAARG